MGQIKNIKLHIVTDIKTQAEHTVLLHRAVLSLLTHKIVTN